jgi:hypothetical protein
LVQLRYTHSSDDTTLSILEDLHHTTLCLTHTTRDRNPHAPFPLRTVAAPRSPKSKTRFGQPLLLIPDRQTIPNEFNNPKKPAQRRTTSQHTHSQRIIRRLVCRPSRSCASHRTLRSNSTTHARARERAKDHQAPTHPRVRTTITGHQTNNKPKPRIIIIILRRKRPVVMAWHRRLRGTNRPTDRPTD